MFEIISKSVNDTKEIGTKLAPYLNCGHVITLSGELGAGKTAFVSGILKYFNKEHEAASPTFTIINQHDLSDNLKLFHFDVYRFDFEDEFTAIGGEEFFSQGICIIEWAERIKGLLPKEYLKVTIEKFDEDTESRKFYFEPLGAKYEKLIKEAFENEDTRN